MQALLKEERAHLSLGDERRNKRFISMVERKVSQPAASLPELGSDWREVKRRYEFYHNEKVQEAQWAAVVEKATVDRCSGHAVILHVLDTTNVRFSCHAEGLGYLDHSVAEGLLVHPSLLLDGAGGPLGLLHQKSWARDKKEMGKKKWRAKKAITEKESYPWIESLQKAEQRLREVPLLLHIADREADLYELFAPPRRPGLELLVRATHARSTLLGHSRWQEVDAQAVLYSFELEVPKVRSEEVSKVQMQLKAGLVMLAPPKCKAHLPALIVYGIVVEEVNPPPGEEALLWRLLTTLPVESATQALQLVRGYSYRWRIERFHYVLKSGCRLEDLPLRHGNALRKATILYSWCAFKIMQLLYLSRPPPTLSCTGFFVEEEWTLLTRLAQKHPVVSGPPPTLKQCVIMLAKLGGYLARNNDGPPGSKNLWRGLQKFTVCLEVVNLKKQWLSTS